MTISGGRICVAGAAVSVLVTTQLMATNVKFDFQSSSNRSVAVFVDVRAFDTDASDVRRSFVGVNAVAATAAVTATDRRVDDAE